MTPSDRLLAEADVTGRSPVLVDRVAAAWRGAAGETGAAGATAVVSLHQRTFVADRRAAVHGIKLGDLVLTVDVGATPRTLRARCFESPRGWLLLDRFEWAPAPRWAEPGGGPAPTIGSVRIAHVSAGAPPALSVVLEVLDPAGRPIPDVQAHWLSAFVVDDGQLARGLAPSELRRSTDPAALVLVVARYQGTKTTFELQKAGLDALLAGAQPQDLVAIVDYADTVRNVLGFTPDKAEARRVLQGLSVIETPTNEFLGALHAALAAFPPESADFPASRSVVLMADGLDSGLADPRALVQRIKHDIAPLARATHAEFHALGHAVGSDRGLRILDMLAHKFGGSFRRVRSITADGVASEFASILERLHGRYVLRVEAWDLDPSRNHWLVVRAHGGAGPIDSAPVGFGLAPVEDLQRPPWWLHWPAAPEAPAVPSAPLALPRRHEAAGPTSDNGPTEGVTVATTAEYAKVVSEDQLRLVVDGVDEPWIVHGRQAKTSVFSIYIRTEGGRGEGLQLRMCSGTEFCLTASSPESPGFFGTEKYRGTATRDGEHLVLAVPVALLPRPALLWAQYRSSRCEEPPQLPRFRLAGDVEIPLGYQHGVLRLQ